MSKKIKSTKPKKATVTAPGKPAGAKSQSPCRALEIGHRSCNCGREGCSFNAPKK